MPGVRIVRPAVVERLPAEDEDAGLEPGDFG